jgi:hypothetical protein
MAAIVARRSLGVAVEMFLVSAFAASGARVPALRGPRDQAPGALGGLPGHRVAAPEPLEEVHDFERAVGPGEPAQEPILLRRELEAVEGLDEVVVVAALGQVQQVALGAAARVIHRGLTIALSTLASCRGRIGMRRAPRACASAFRSAPVHAAVRTWRGLIAASYIARATRAPSAPAAGKALGKSVAAGDPSHSRFGAVFSAAAARATLKASSVAHSARAGVSSCPRPLLNQRARSSNNITPPAE